MLLLTISWILSFTKFVSSLLAAFESNILVIYNVDTDNDIFKTVARMGVPRSDDYDITNAVHWLYDGTQFTTSSKRHVYFWDAKMCCLMENVQLNTQILNHVIAKNEYISNNYIAGQFQIIYLCCRHIQTFIT